MERSGGHRIARTGAVPTTCVFERNGNRVGKPLIGQQSYEAFSRVVQPLLHP